MKFAIVDDDRDMVEGLASLLSRACEKRNIVCETDRYYSGDSLLDRYRSHFDAVFLDIEMNGLSGMETARRLRETDDRVALVFVTQMAQYAVESYRVDALDYLLKPVSEFQFELVFRKIIKYIARNKDRTLTFTFDGVSRLIPASTIQYVEVQGHYLSLGTLSESIRVKGSLKDVERDLSGLPFVKCNRYCLVNLRHVSSVSREALMIGKTTFYISRRNQIKVLQSVAEFIGGKI